MRTSEEISRTLIRNAVVLDTLSPVTPKKSLHEPKRENARVTGRSDRPLRAAPGFAGAPPGWSTLDHDKGISGAPQTFAAFAGTARPVQSHRQARYVYDAETNP